MTSLQCLEALDAAQERLAGGVKQLGADYERLLQVIDETSKDVQERINAISESVESEIDALEEWLHDQAEDTLPAAAGELRSSLEEVVADAFSTCEQSIDNTIRESSQAFDTVTGEIQDSVDKSAEALISSGSTQVAGFQAEVERRIVRHCEAQARELSEDALKDLAASAALDATVSQLSATLSTSMSAAVPYLVAAKAALGPIRRAMELIR